MSDNGDLARKDNPVVNRRRSASGMQSKGGLCGGVTQEGAKVSVLAACYRIIRKSFWPRSSFCSAVGTGTGYLFETLSVRRHR